MKRQTKRRTIALLTVSLSLVATHALAWDFRVTNSSGDSVQVNCSTETSTNLQANGATQIYSCSGTASVQRPGSSSQYDIPNNCGSGYIPATTVTAGESADTLSLAHQCISEESTF